MGYRQEKSANEQRKLDFMWKHLGPHFGHYRIDQLDRAKAVSYADKRHEQGAKTNTVLRELGAVRAAARWYDRSLPRTWYMPTKPDGKDRYLTKSEFERLVKAADSHHIRVFIILALATGARTSAILELTWDMVDFERRLINLGRGNRIKRRATVPINDRALEELRIAYEYRTSDYVISFGDGPVKSIRKGFEGARDRAGLGKDVTPHVLRHSAAVWMAENGISMSEIAQYLGHSSTHVTEKTYARYSPDYLRKASDILQ